MAKEELAGQEAVLAILKRLPTSVVISDFATGQVLWTNTWNIGIVGATHPDELIGRSLLEFIPPEQHGHAIEAIEMVSQGEDPGPIIYRIRKLDGTLADAQISSVLIRYNGDPAMLSLLSDVSAREEAMRDFAESEERYRLLVETSPDGIVVCVDDDIVYANPALLKALGANSPDDLIGRSMFEFIDSADHKRVREGRKALMMTKKPHPAAEVTLRRVNGEPLPATAQATLVRWRGLPATQTLMHDILARMPDQQAGG